MYGTSSDRIAFVVQLIEDASTRSLGFVACPGDHGSVLPCPECGAAL